jgi:thioesterase domain-containing protein
MGFPYAGLSRELHRQRPLFCLQASGLVEGEPFANTTESAAAEYVDIIRSIRPSGPYHLFGWSFGGIMANAVACLLQQQGQRVDFLGIVDAYPKATAENTRFYSISAYLKQIREHLEETLQDARKTHIDRLLRLTINHAMLMAVFRPQLFHGDILLIAASENQDLSRLWQPFISGQIIRRDLPCNHMQMMDLEFVGRIAAFVEQQLPN